MFYKKQFSHGFTQMSTDYQSAGALDESPLIIQATLQANGGFTTMLCFVGVNPCTSVADRCFLAT